MTSLIEWSRRNARPLWELVFEKEDEDIQVYLSEVWDTMQNAVQRGLEHEGVLPGELELDRKAHGFFQKS